MHFFALVLSGLALLSHTTLAFPTADNWVVLSTEETTNGTLTFYSPPSSRPSAPALAERQYYEPKCPKVEQTCGKTDQAEATACDALINMMNDFKRIKEPVDGMTRWLGPLFWGVADFVASLAACLMQHAVWRSVLRQLGDGCEGLEAG